MQRHGIQWKTLKVVVGAGALCLALVWGALYWPELMMIQGLPAYLRSPKLDAPPPLYPFLEVLKLMVAALLGLVISAVHKYCHRDKLLSRSLEQAQILLCVAGALMMIIIGGSMPRAFGVLGAAGMIRFRTPIEDPKDTAVLFLLIGVGMACGLSSFGVAGLATIFLCLFLLVLDQIGEQKPRAMMLKLVADSREFPTAHVQNIFNAYGTVFEPREVSQGDGATVRYHVMLAPNTSLEYMSEQLMSGGYSGLKSVTWELPKKSN